jgi:ATP-dependent protease ClpP protease subunit
MKQIDIRGVIVQDDDLWIYEWFEMTATSPQSVRAALAEANGDDVVVTINSGGGDVEAGQEIYTLLRGYAGRITIQVCSLAASAASVIAMAGESEISPVAQIMIHNVSTCAKGDHRVMEHTANVLINANEALAAAYVAKTGKSKDEVLALMAKETWLTAEQAVQEGFIDRVMFTETQNQPMRLAASFGTDLLPQNVIEYAKKHFNRKTATATAAAQYQYLLMEGKQND